MKVSFMVRGNQYIQLVRVLYCKLLTIGKKLSTFPGLNCRPQRWEASVLPLYQSSGEIGSALLASGSTQRATCIMKNFDIIGVHGVISG